MRFVLFVEGTTERALREPLKKWLDARISPPVSLQIVAFEGAADLVNEVRARARRFLDAPGGEVIAAIALLDLYEVPLPIPSEKITVAERVAWVTLHMEAKVSHPKFRQFLAVQEIEAWLLGDTHNFPPEVRAALAGMGDAPEAVSGQEPPGRLLERLYRTKTGRRYRKVEEGRNLFGKLNIEAAYQKCPNLKALLDGMLQLAQETQI